METALGCIWLSVELGKWDISRLLTVHGMTKPEMWPQVQRLCLGQLVTSVPPLTLTLLLRWCIFVTSQGEKRSLSVCPLGIKFIDMFYFYKTIIRRTIVSTYTCEFGRKIRRRGKSKIIVLLLSPSLSAHGNVVGIREIHWDHNFPGGDEFHLPGVEPSMEEEGMQDTRCYLACAVPPSFSQWQISRALLFGLYSDSSFSTCGSEAFVTLHLPSWFWACTSDPSWANSCSCLGFPEAETPFLSCGGWVDLNLKLAASMVMPEGESGARGLDLRSGEEPRLAFCMCFQTVFIPRAANLKNKAGSILSKKLRFNDFERRSSVYLQMGNRGSNGVLRFGCDVKWLGKCVCHFPSLAVFCVFEQRKHCSEKTQSVLSVILKLFKDFLF